MSSDLPEGGFSQQLEALRQRLSQLSVQLVQLSVQLNDRLNQQAIVDPALQQAIVQELQIALAVLQAAQGTLQQAAQQTAEGAAVAQLRSSVQEKEVLLRELHHRVKNNLQIVSSLLDLQVMRTEDPIVQTLLRNNQSRIHSIALVHEQLSQAENLTEISLGQYVQNLVITLVRLYAIVPNQMTLRTDIDASIRVSPDRAVPVGLILNELLANAIRHGLQDHAGEIGVSLRLAAIHRITLTVSDSGNRLPPDFQPETARSLGLQLVQSLVQQVNGTLEVERRDRTIFRVQFATDDERERSG